LPEYSELDKSVGRLIAGRLPGLELEAEHRQALGDGILGGITLFAENCSDLEQLASLTADIVETSRHVPLLTVDQEGGAVQRFAGVLTPLPSPMALAATGSPETLAAITRISAEQLKLLGFNCLLAPVLDVISNPSNPIVCTRSFGTVQQLCQSLGEIVARTISDVGLVPVGKHFPGHGATREDSHEDLAVSKVDLERLWGVDLAPFKDCLPVLPAVLTGHIWVQAVDEEPLPASLSKRITTSILREYLGFDGIIMTDDLTMKGITGHYGMGEAAVMAIEAGADLLLVCGPFEESEEARRAIVEAVSSGRLSEARIAASLKRLKHKFGRRPQATSPSKNKGRFARLKKHIEESRAVSQEASLEAITATRGSAHQLTSGPWKVIVPNHPRYSLDLARHLNGYLNARLEAPVEEIRYSLEPSFEEAQEIARSCQDYNCLFVTFRCLINREQMRVGQMVADACKGKKIAITTDTPFDLDGLPDWPTVIASFDPSDQAMMALASVLSGELRARHSTYVQFLYEGLKRLREQSLK